MKIRLATAGLALLTAACFPGESSNNVGEAAVIGNAGDAYRDTVRDANARADRLDELADGLDRQADRARGSARDALRNEAQDDYAAAAAVRAQGQRDAESNSEAIERDAGLINAR